jgi:predicted lipoprotein with Yx(FWY)xxD motif
MRLKSLLSGGIAAVLVVAIGFFVISRNVAGNSYPAAPLATPLGVTLQNMLYQVPAPYTLYSVVKQKYRFGDPAGMTAYVTDKDTQPGVSSCTGDCADNWPPVLAPEGAAPFGDWTILTRADGARQWAYRGKPLYTSSNDPHWGETKGDHVDGVWHVAAPVWNNDAPLPPYIAIKEVAEALGQVLVDDRGMALYAYTGSSGDDGLKCGTGPCAHRFIPYAAPQAAHAIGDFTMIDREDGTRQWVFKGYPLYSYNGDVRLGDANGKDVDRRFQLAMIARYFLPREVMLRPDEKFGGIWTTTGGMTLYMRELLHYTASGSHSSRNGDPGVPELGMVVGLLGCDADCEKTHPPLLAPDSSQASGYWTVLKRPDGRKQWAYQGYALYASERDKKPGDMLSNDDYDVLRVESVALRSAIDPFGSGLYWHAVAP